MRTNNPRSETKEYQGSIGNDVKIDILATIQTMAFLRSTIRSDTVVIADFFRLLEVRETKQAHVFSVEQPK